MNFNQTHRNWIGAALKLIVFAATLYYLYVKVLSSENFGRFIEDFKNLEQLSISILIMVVFLMFLNWSIETVKWKTLISKLENISFTKAFMAVWAGLTINNWVPNRAAEFLGRIVFISNENRIKAISSTLVGNLAQLITMLSIGSLAFILWTDFETKIIDLLLYSVAIALGLLLSNMYFNIRALSKWFERFKILNRFKKYVEVLESYTKKELTFVLLLSIVRLSVYVAQYYLLFRLFGFNVEPEYAVIGIISIFFIQSVLPAITITELGVRGATVVFVFERFTSEYAILLAAAYSLWLINVIVPTLFGAIFIVTKKSQTKRN